MLANLYSLFASLYKLEFDTDGEDRPIPKVIHLSAPAKKEWVAWVTSHYQEQTVEGFPDFLRGPWAKLEAYCARLALILHCCRVVSHDTQSEEIDEESVVAAGSLIDYFKSHTRRVYPRLRSTVADRHADSARTWIAKHNNQASARDLLRSNVAGIKTASEARKLIADLVDRRLGTIEKIGNRELFKLFLPDTRHLDEKVSGAST